MAIWIVGNSVVASMPVLTSGETRTWTSCADAAPIKAIHAISQSSVHMQVRIDILPLLVSSGAAKSPSRFQVGLLLPSLVHHAGFHYEPDTLQYAHIVVGSLWTATRLILGLEINRIRSAAFTAA